MWIWRTLRDSSLLDLFISRGESDRQQGRLEAMRFSPRAVPTGQERPARLYRTTLAATSCYACSSHAQALHGSRAHDGCVPVLYVEPVPQTSASSASR